MPKFFVKNNQINEDIITIIGQDVNHILNVLRLNLGDEITVCNSDNECNYICEICSLHSEKINCKIIKDILNEQNTKTEITIFQGLPKGDKFELIIQKCTELGVQQIEPVAMKRCVSKLDEKSASKKIERWQKIAEAASKQCSRNNICKINNITNLKNICNIIQDYDILLVPYENEKNNSFKSVLKSISNKDTTKIGIVIGPEGGFEEEEIKMLEQNGAKIITIGNRILRTETVAIAMASAIMYEFNELG